ncbi:MULTISPECIES: ATP-dependent zinc metalloprotease FtsH [unclassified Amycolatopsis]|uniref:ATP-dependent zinc metalloprotease FtsH n=1 Tax=unclassified Amycolatopsis TaxID=2618356 RepID=UPI002876C41E|nr:MULTISPECIES: ATP-dependent zinc metalloprotease FtsH [unclassified Amycolatopsis]MDS0134698.1 ATP-dependent metallopeptidase FtsH/Yme1/Tma family protein [Amycolatopsis sp. 505]MDS0147403.1 ATP-dependent metallopeptidase FtsH/Yme1/Tma family protein [Amycolatopsis sp. CM201R]
MSRTARSGPPPTPAPKPEPPRRPRAGNWLLTAIGLLILGVLVVPAFLTPAAPSMTYTEFLSEVDAGHVESVTVDDQGAVDGKRRGGPAFTTRIPTALEPGQLESKLREKNVEITAAKASGSLLSVLLGYLPFFLLLGFLVWAGMRARKSAGGGLGMTGFGRAKAKIIEAQRPTTRFADIAGYEGVKQEIGEIIDFLRDPARYAAAGAKGPRGVIMVGPPGTGKTLFARAVAGEASVPFLSITGSAFVEMFVGVGASRVRDLFEEARTRAPSIIFIDEIDAVGGRRGTGGHDEREQTLNQLLAEMDGFDQSGGVVVLAATNRPETLDAALLRPGRFDRQVTVPLPNQAERAAILATHIDGKHLAPDVDLGIVARGTPGFSGADLANLVNEAAINAVRDDRTVLTAADLAAARDRVLLGRRDSSNALLPEERHSVAVHESGHALVAALCEHADPVAKVTILPAGMALGATEQLPEAERHLYRESHLTDLLAVRLGGRAAELAVFGETSTGAANDLAGATALAAKMVTEFGMSPELGPIGYSAAEGQPELLGRPYSEQTQRAVDEEIARLVRAAQDRATDLLQRHRAALDALAGQLQERETVDGTVVLAVLREEAAGSPLAEGLPTAANGHVVALRSAPDSRTGSRR